ncbi:hypothetical protein [Brevundimonas sp.]|uniref:hypothetical protein n=1 Tax=Brevundimonas sp. TaxID=1871086 RepID=UPI002AB9D489|nr:hypothetical protein [Brevundimonas sp.]MDZ4363625.1 hypothetical protein [Brevundimonas sp.]
MKQADGPAAPPPPPRQALILRRIAGHLRHQDWTAVIVEFLVVVLGVFIGLQATNWNNDLTDRRREAGILRDIVSDLHQDREELAAGRANALRRVAAAGHVLERATGRRLTTLHGPRIDNRNLSLGIGTPVPVTGPPDEADLLALWPAVVTGYYPTPSTTAFDALTSAGRLDLIRDAGLVRQLQAYRLVLDGLGATQNNALRPQIIGVRQVGETHGLSAFAPVDEDVLIREVAASPQLRATLESQLGWAVIHLAQIDSADRLAVALLARLDRAGFR